MDEKFHLRRPKAPLPSLRDFAPSETLDELCAWGHFGKSSLAQAYETYMRNPCFYDGDFLHMGTVAFHYYFPIWDQYLRDSITKPEMYEGGADTIADYIDFRFQHGDFHATASYLRELAELSVHVRAHIMRLEEEGCDKRADKKWAKLQNHLSKYMTIDQSKSSDLDE